MTADKSSTKLPLCVTLCSTNKLDLTIPPPKLSKETQRWNCGLKWLHFKETNLIWLIHSIGWILDCIFAQSKECWFCCPFYWNCIMRGSFLGQYGQEKLFQCTYFHVCIVLRQTWKNPIKCPSVFEKRPRLQLGDGWFLTGFMWGDGVPDFGLKAKAVLQFWRNSAGPDVLL